MDGKSHLDLLRRPINDLSVVDLWYLPHPQQLVMAYSICSPGTSINLTSVPDLVCARVTSLAVL